jgi:hypothetical protein
MNTNQGFVYRVSWYENGKLKIDGGFTFDRANSFAERLRNKFNVRDVQVRRTSEIFGSLRNEVVSELY